MTVIGDIPKLIKQHCNKQVVRQGITQRATFFIKETLIKVLSAHSNNDSLGLESKGFAFNQRFLKKII